MPREMHPKTFKRNKKALFIVLFDDDGRTVTGGTFEPRYVTWRNKNFVEGGTGAAAFKGRPDSRGRGDDEITVTIEFDSGAPVEILFDDIVYEDPIAVPPTARPPKGRGGEGSKKAPGGAKGKTDAKKKTPVKKKTSTVKKSGGKRR